MLVDKISEIKIELESVIKKEQEVEKALLQVKELKLKYLGAIEILEQLSEDKDFNCCDEKKDKKDK
jgi:hypothetical protein